MKKSFPFLLLIVCLPALAGDTAPAYSSARTEVQQFVQRMEKEHGFEPAAIEGVLEQAQKQQTILDAIARPAEKTLSWGEYRTRFVTDKRIAEGTQFWAEHREALDAAESRYGVPAQYIVAIIGVETSWGRITGRYRVVDALATLAFDYPPRAAFFSAELEQYFLLAREESIDPLSKLGSYAGAMGAPQFMPRSVREFAVDGDGDGKRDLWSSWPDIVSSVAHYLQVHGWKSGEDVDAHAPPEDAAADVKPTGGHNFGVIMRYNRSPLYAMAVCEMASRIAAQVFKDGKSE